MVYFKIHKIDFLTIYHLDFVAVLEPRISGANADNVIQRIGLVEGARIDARGFSGGIRCLWKSNFMAASVISTNRYCIHLKLNPNSPSFWFSTIVYASPDVIDREELWNDLREFNSNNRGPWCIAGDFNAIVSSQERNDGAALNHRSSSSFVECIEDCGLIDMGFSGPPFTWSKGVLRERLDRVLCNEAWQSPFPTSSVTHVPLPSSNHCGLWLKVNDGNSRPRRNYFKFLGAWLDHSDFENQVKHSWSISSPWEENIQRLTSNLQTCNKEVLGNIFKKKHRLLKRLEGINKVLLRGPNERLMSLRDDLWQEYNMPVTHEESYWFQQARTNWVSLGDLNTRFFHQSSLKRRRKNRIMALQNEEGQWIYENDLLQQHIIDFYSNLYSSSNNAFYAFNIVSSFPCIRTENRLILEASVTLEEVKRALFSMTSYKSPGPDGFHPLFFKSQWEKLGSSILKMVTNCFTNPLNIGLLNKTVITLIPKCEDPSKVSQLRPIAL